MAVTSLPDQIPLPAQMPVMVLNDCYLFPGCVLPLFIFEERYRAMLRHALSGDRMFCIGTRQDEKGDRVLPWSTAGLIRACVHQADGTSQLMLYGMHRIKLTGWTQLEPFRVAQIEPVRVTPPEASIASELVAEALSLLPSTHPSNAQSIQLLRESLSAMPCCDRVCDVLAYHFVRETGKLRTLLSETDTLCRLRFLIAELRCL